jgi:hypothetical protein
MCSISPGSRRELLPAGKEALGQEGKAVVLVRARARELGRRLLKLADPGLLRSGERPGVPRRARLRGGAGLGAGSFRSSWNAVRSWTLCSSATRRLARLGQLEVTVDVGQGRSVGRAVAPRRAGRRLEVGPADVRGAVGGCGDVQGGFEDRCHRGH